mmetsp:Transcript_690/g.1353  ORF Transcript_690/g.1353 Transcript_690/m.1353 type:complete len:99 (+) Transcript_690:55-351(+)
MQSKAPNAHMLEHVIETKVEHGAPPETTQVRNQFIDSLVTDVGTCLQASNPALRWFRSAIHFRALWHVLGYRVNIDVGRLSIHDVHRLAATDYHPIEK